MDSDHASMAITVPVLAAVVLAAPVLLLWLGLVVLARADQPTRTDLIGGLGCGLIAAGAAAALGTATGWLAGTDEPQRLTVYVPLSEETLKGAALVAAIGVTAVLHGSRLTVRRCVIATVTVVAAFAAGENLGYLGMRLLAGNTYPGDWVAMMEMLRVRALLPPVGHLAETWPLGAALWLASRYRDRYRRAAVLLSGWAAAVALHALWNGSALQWWPDPWPLLAIAALSLGAATACTAAACRCQRQPRPDSARPGSARGAAARGGAARDLTPVVVRHSRAQDPAPPHQAREG